MNIDIRPAVEADAELLSALNADVQAVHAKALPARFKLPGPDTFPPEAARALLANPSNLLVLAFSDEAPAGYAYAEVVRRAETPFCYAHDLIYVHHLSVRIEFRRKGVGRALLDAVRSSAERLGVTTLALDVWSFNEDARSFFRSYGLTVFNERLWNVAPQ
jgi:ribosomal protein S18 acetylase RimI-like enzyme